MVDANSGEQAVRGGRGAVHTVLESEITRIVLRGEVDASLSDELTDAVAAAESAANPTEVETGEVTFIDSSGVALLARLAGRTPGRLVVCDPPEVLTFLLAVTRIGDVVEIRHTGSGGDDTSPQDPPDAVA